MIQNVEVNLFTYGVNRKIKKLHLISPIVFFQELIYDSSFKDLESIFVSKTFVKFC